MSKSDFDIIFNQTFKIAKELSESEFTEESHKKFKIYSNFITQLIQILSSISVKDDEIKLAIKNLLEEDKKVQYRMIQHKDEISKKITNRIRKEHIRQKYYSKSLRTALLNKKA